jgi:hypothetical protein
MAWYALTPRSIRLWAKRPLPRASANWARHTTPAKTFAFIKAERADFGAIAKADKISVE